MGNLSNVVPGETGDKMCGKIDSIGFMKMKESYFMDPSEQHLSSGIPDGTPEPRANKITQVSKKLDDFLSTRTNMWQTRVGGSSLLAN